jgi:toxin ParE1/3/4
MTTLVVSADAEADTIDILAYLTTEAGPLIAAEYGDRFHTTIERMVELPESGAPRPHLGSNTRIAVVAPYVLIFDYDQDHDLLTLLRVLHGKRDIASVISKRL